MLPTSVMEAVAVTVTLSLSASARPETDTVPSRGVPSYSLDLDSVVMVTAAGLTVRVPFTVLTFVKYPVTSLSPFRIEK